MDFMGAHAGMSKGMDDLDVLHFETCICELILSYLWDMRIIVDVLSKRAVMIVLPLTWVFQLPLLIYDDCAVSRVLRGTVPSPIRRDTALH